MEVLKKDVSWRTSISGLIEQMYYEALQVFREMIAGDCQTRPNVATMILLVCGNLGSLDHTKCFHDLLEKSGWLELDIAIASFTHKCLCKEWKYEMCCKCSMTCMIQRGM
ncbi:Hypothetical predicted protein [Olea europaea subsp. europaea]|uniref:Pentatricopeptide repeat-containing protein n=1 Tax=Olea europaea subsp. europaea TaxID=158383 RepID=A0A8S0V7B7_OLEEU|nr:Hypothetical predicted protein [Olea europaea subsp. europaea]CAA3027236.1 Hypothetical predicted protein [Olea europaea subsp. europaea]